jgi:pimeloyl-ACP methyl ester carboxylesterase
MENNMKKGWKITLIVLASLLMLVLVGPFLVPVPPLKDALPPQSLADPDSQFIEINDIDVHYKQMGSGDTIFILLHGFGASTFSWREVMEPLAAFGRVIAYDRPAFGLTERPMTWDEINPYTQESNINLLLGMMNAMEVEQAILIGNSAGGTVATAFALTHPERVQALIEVDAAIYMTMPNSALLQWLLDTPQLDRLGPLIARQIGGGRGDDFLKSAFHDSTLVEQNPKILEGYRKPLSVENWDRALWEFTKASEPVNLAEQLDQISVPTLVISGDDDRIVPLENSLRLAEDIPGASLAVLENCGHVPQEECPTAFMLALINFITDLPKGDS